MKRRRFFEALTTALLAVLIGAVLAGPAMAQGNSGKNKDKDDGGTATPPPITYLIQWIDYFQVTCLNEQGDVAGMQREYAYGPAKPAVFYDGTSYLLEAFVSDPTVSLRLVIDVSDRIDEDAFFACGSCNTSDGIRGWRMLLGADDTGMLELIQFDLIEPLDGDDTSALFGVNMWGETTGVSSLGGGFPGIAIYYDDTSGLRTVGDGVVITSYPKINNVGEVIGWGEIVGHASTAAFRWRLDDATESWDGLFVSDSNNLGHFIGTTEIDTTDRKGNVVTERWNFLYDNDEVSLLDLQTNNNRIVAMNDVDDLLFFRNIPKGRHRYYTGAVYFADLDETFLIDDLIDPSNSEGSQAMWLDPDKHVSEINTAGVIAGHVSGGPAFLLFPVE